MYRHAFDQSHFSAALQQYSKGLPLRAVAERSGVSASTISRIIRGSLPDLETFVQLCGAMQVEPREFFYSVEVDKL